MLRLWLARYRVRFWDEVGKRALRRLRLAAAKIETARGDLGRLEGVAVGGEITITWHDDPGLRRVTFVRADELRAMRDRLLDVPDHPAEKWPVDGPPEYIDAEDVIALSVFGAVAQLAIEDAVATLDRLLGDRPAKRNPDPLTPTGGIHP